jgi:hypothetical protein
VGRQCTVCNHSNLEDINMRLARNEVFRTIADDTGLSETALKRHKAEHIPKVLTKAEEAREVTKANALLEDIKALRVKAMDILDQAEQAGDLKTALLGIREARGCLELLARVEGQIKDRPQINILIDNPEWVELRTLIISALEAFPDAKEAVINAIR